MTSVFAQYQSQNFRYRYSGTLHLDSIAGGTPLDPAMLERHIGTKLDAPDNIVRDAVQEIILETGKSLEEAIEEAAKMKGLVGFYSDPNFYIPGANFKAGIVESACIAASTGRVEARGWGKTNAGIKKFLSEHVFVIENRLYLQKDGQPVTEPSETAQSFIHKVLPGKGPISAIQYTQVVYDADLSFTVETDFEFDEPTWAAIWLTAEKEGFGAARKRGYGTGEMVKWEPVTLEAPKASGRKKKDDDGLEAVAA